MTNQEAIEELNEQYANNLIIKRQMRETWSGMLVGQTCEALKMGIEALKEQEKYRWHPVSEGLPKEEKEYMCCNKDGHRYIFGFSKDLYKYDKYDFAEFKEKRKAGFYDYDSEWGYRYVDDVVAWMELPEPYKQVD